MKIRAFWKTHQNSTYYYFYELSRYKEKLFWLQQPGIVLINEADPTRIVLSYNRKYIPFSWARDDLSLWGVEYLEGDLDEN